MHGSNYIEWCQSFTIPVREADFIARIGATAPVSETEVQADPTSVGGVVDGVIATADVRGNLGNMEYDGSCFEPDGTSYKKYIQVP